MTTAETIKLLDCLKGMIEWDYPLDYQGAIDKAIEELKNGGYEAGYLKGFRDGLMQRQKVRND